MIIIFCALWIDGGGGGERLRTRPTASNTRNDAQEIFAAAKLHTRIRRWVDATHAHIRTGVWPHGKPKYTLRPWMGTLCVCAYACTGNEKCAQHKMYPWCLPACMLLDACSWSTHLCPTNQVNIIQCGQCYFSLLEWMPNGKHYTSFAVLLQQQFWRRRGECERARSEKSPDTRSTI